LGGVKYLKTTVKFEVFAKFYNPLPERLRLRSSLEGRVISTEVFARCYKPLPESIASDPPSRGG
jgi:hypothetical protein